MIDAASKIAQMSGDMTNTFGAIEFARLVDFYFVFAVTLESRGCVIYL